MACIHVAPGHHEIVDIAGIHRAEGQIVKRRLAPVYGGLAFEIKTVGGLVLHGPADCYYLVGPVLPLAVYVVLGKNVVTLDSVCIAAGREHGDKVEVEILSLRILAAIF